MISEREVDAGNAESDSSCSVFDLEFDLSLLTNHLSLSAVPGATSVPRLHLSSEFLLQFVITDLNHGRAPMGATIRQIAGEEIVNELINLDGTKLVAHEGGHFMGLYHTTESRGELFDPLADTPTCACETCAPAASQSQCATPGKTPPTTPYQMKATDCNKTTSPPTCGGGEDLMFWLLNQSVSRGTLSPQQGQIIRANPLVQQ